MLDVIQTYPHAINGKQLKVSVRLACTRVISGIEEDIQLPASAVVGLHASICRMNIAWL